MPTSEFWDEHPEDVWDGPEIGRLGKNEGNFLFKTSRKKKTGLCGDTKKRVKKDEYVFFCWKQFGKVV